MHAEAESDGALPLAEPDVTPAQRPYFKTAETGEPPYKKTVGIAKSRVRKAQRFPPQDIRKTTKPDMPPVQTTQQTCNVAVPLNRRKKRAEIETGKPPY